MARHSDRKLFLFGRYSLALLLPKTWLKELGVTAGNQVHLEFDRARKRIVVRLEEGSGIAPKETRQKPKPSENDWTPLPEL
jgi:antitoxin component of MazEF toxin-antitoxin module